MPYCGRPSPGCQICRIRKIKCDRAEPICQNCEKAKWKCPGYRNTIDLLFHDESAKVEAKIKGAKRKPRDDNKNPFGGAKTLQNDCKSKPGANKIKPKVVNRQRNTPPPRFTFETPTAALSYDLDESAIALFIHLYVIGGAGTYGLRRAIDSSSCLKATVIALGAAALTSFGPGVSRSEDTQLRFTEAIHLTNESLQSPVDVKKDSTLLAVNLLGIFEIKTGSQQRPEAWHEHIQGAAALLAYRGAKQFETAEGGRLFMQTVWSLIISSVIRRFEIPSHVLSLLKLAEKQIPDPEDWDWRCFCLNVRFARLYARLLPNNLLPSPAEAGILQEAWDLDQDMIELLQDSSDDWHFKTIHMNTSDMFFSRIYAFPHYFAAQQYNSILCKRIILQDIMLKILWFHPDLSSLQLNSSDLLQIRNASETIREIQADILRSVPQHLGMYASSVDFMSPFASSRVKHLPRDNMWTNFVVKDQSPWRSRPKQDPILPAVRGCCGYTFHWPLFIVGAADALDGSIRLFAIQSLRSLAQTMRLQQAFLLADRLEKGEGEQLNAHIEFAKEYMY